MAKLRKSTELCDFGWKVNLGFVVFTSGYLLNPRFPSQNAITLVLEHFPNLIAAHQGDYGSIQTI